MLVAVAIIVVDVVGHSDCLVMVIALLAAYQDAVPFHYAAILVDHCSRASASCWLFVEALRRLNKR